MVGILVGAVAALPEGDVQTRCIELVDIARENGPEAAAWQIIQDWQKLQELAASLPAEPPLRALCARLGLVERLLRPPLLRLAMACPSLTSLQIEAAANASLRLRDFRRAQVLLQLGAPFRLMALSQVLFSPRRVRAEKDAEGAISQRFHIALQALKRFGPPPPPQPWKRRAGTDDSLQVKVMSLCDTGGGNFNGTAAPVTAENHRAWAKTHGYEYVMLHERPLADLEPQYSKVRIAADAIAPAGAPDWFVWLDCDALVMDRSVSVGTVLDAYNAREADFVIAEEPSGINSGVFFLRGSPTARLFMEVVGSSDWSMVWDQSMFLNGMVARSDLFGAEACSSEEAVWRTFEWSAGMMTVHQAAMNLYSAGSAAQWGAAAWEEGGFIIHFAGCPLSHPKCWQKFVAAADWAREHSG